MAQVGVIKTDILDAMDRGECDAAIMDADSWRNFRIAGTNTHCRNKVSTHTRPCPALSTVPHDTSHTVHPHPPNPALHAVTMWQVRLPDVVMTMANSYPVRPLPSPLPHPCGLVHTHYPPHAG
jgi:hypothetical protein